MTERCEVCEGPVDCRCAGLDTPSLSFCRALAQAVGVAVADQRRKLAYRYDIGEKPWRAVLAALDALLAEEPK